MFIVVAFYPCVLRIRNDGNVKSNTHMSVLLRDRMCSKSYESELQTKSVFGGKKIY